MTRLIEELNHDQYDVRERAAARLADLAQQADMRAELANQVQWALLSAETTFEVRSRLAALARKLPPAGKLPPADASHDELDRLIAQMDAPSYAVRQGSAARLQWLAARPELACPIMSRLKGRLSDPHLPAGLGERLAPILETARRGWLTSDPQLWRFEAVSDAQIERWLDELIADGAPQPGARPVAARQKPNDGTPQLDLEELESEAPAIDGRLPRALSRQSVRGHDQTGPSQFLEGAARELVDLMALDGHLPRVKQAIEQRLDAGVHPGAEARLTELLDWTRPAMVAEYWESRRHLGIQHLLIGVPSFSPLAERPSHFDRIDDQTAHCVSGNALMAGQDYPVGVLFPHPKRANAQFHLVSLPTPRHRLAYEYLVKVDEAVRLVQLSERTLAALSAEKRGLSEAELMMLRHLDMGAVSRFAGPYFLAVDDQPLPGDAPQRAWISTHAGLCLILAIEGTREAVPGLLEAIQAERFTAPSPVSPHDWPWIAALAIARRDPWPEVDAWLAGLIESEHSLRVLGESQPQLGALAASILLDRHGGSADQFGLVPASDQHTGALGFVLYRFDSPQSARQVLAWWDRKAAEKSQVTP